MRRILRVLALLLIALPFLAMYGALVLRAFGSGRLGVVPETWTIENFSFLWRPIGWGLGTTSVWQVVANTVLFATLSGLTVAVICMLGGYALSRIRFRGRSIVLVAQLALHAVPGEILLIATFFLLFYTGLLGRIEGVAMARAALEVPLGIWIAKGFFDGIPVDVERAAMVDGCSRAGAWFRVLLPLVRPGAFAVFIWGFLFAWHDFIYVYTLLPGTSRLLATLIQNLLATEVVDYGVLAAMSIFYALPPLVLFVMLQTRLKGIPVPGGKGG